MPQEISAWAAKDGTLYLNACDAAKCDLQALVKNSPLAENGPYAKKLVDWLTAEAPAILEVLGDYRDSCPIPPKEEAAPEKPEGTLRRDPRAKPCQPSCASNFDGNCDCQEF